MTTRVPTQAAKSAAKRTLRIVSKCSTQAEFVAVFRRLCDQRSIFIATSKPKAAGTQVRFNVTLADGTSMLAGEGDVSDSFPSRDNRWGRPGMRIEFSSLASHSQRTLELFASESSAQLQAKSVEPKSTLGGLPPPVRGSAPSPLPLKPSFSVPKVIPPVNKRVEPPKAQSTAADEDEDDDEGDTQLSDPSDGFVLAGEEAKTIISPTDASVDVMAVDADGRAKGSEYILPANPFGELAAESLEAFVECTLYEETGAIALPDADETGDRESPPWWPGSGNTPRPELIPQNIGPLDEPNDDLKALVEASDRSAVPTPVPAPPVLPTPAAPPSPEPAAPDQGVPAPLDQAAPAQAAPTADPDPGQAVPSPIEAPSWYGAPPVGDAPPLESPVPEPSFDARPATPLPVGPTPIPNAVPVSPTPVPNAVPIAPAPYLPSDPNAAWGEPALATAKRKPLLIAGAVVAVAVIVLAFALAGGEDAPTGETDGKGTSAAAPESNAVPSKPEPTSPPPAPTSAPTVAPTPAGETETAREDETETAREGETEIAREGEGQGQTETAREDETETAAPPVEPQAAVAPTPVADGQCALKIDSRPSDVAVFLGNRQLGVAPGELTVPCGKSTLTFKRSRYQVKSATVDAVPGSTTELNVALSRPTHLLKIASLPSQATVYVGGRKLGVTPLKAKLPGYEGASLKIVKPGYKTWTSKIYLKKPSQSVRVRLKRNR